MSHLRRARLGARRPSDHERARRLAAEDLHEPLGPEQAAWLEAHLAVCDACATVAAEYLAQREALRALPKAEPPRDLWARTSAALDREVAHRASGRRAGFAFERRLVPAGALAGALVVAVVVTTSIFSTGIGLLGQVPAPTPGLPSAAIESFAAPTPVTVAAADVAWLAPRDDGTYALNVAPVDRVCPPDAQPDCAPIDGSGRSVVLLSAAPRAVVKAPDKSEVVVVDAATRATGGTVYVVPIVAPTASATPGTTETPIPLATEPPSETEPPPPSLEPSAPVGPSASVEPSPSGPASPSPSGLESPREPSPSASAPETPAVTPAPGGVLAIATDVIVVGETAAYSPDGSWFAFTARPADGGQGPDIYVWHVGDVVAHPVTSDHASVFSAWDGSLLIGSRVAPAGVAPSPSPSDLSLPGFPEGIPSGSPDGTFGPTVETTPFPESTPSPNPVTEASPTTGGSPGPDGSSQPDASAGTSVSPGSGEPVASPVSFLLDPSTGSSIDLPIAAWRPVPDPTGRDVVYWSGTMRFDETSGTWVPGEGQLVVAPWTWLASGIVTASPGGDVLLPSASASPSPDEGSGLPGGSPEGSLPPGFPTPVATPVPTPPPPTPAEPASQSPFPVESGAVASPFGSFPPAPGETPTTPQPLLLPDATGQVATYQDWDVRWDPTGSHLAVWIADALDPGLGRLSLLNVDPTSGQVAGSAGLVTDEPALPGFSLGDERLVWATPPGQDGQGSRLQIVAWSGAATGMLDGQPATGPEQVIVVR